MSRLRYAAGTTVTASQTQGEITGLLGRFGVDRIVNAQEPLSHVIYFEIDGRGFRFTLPLPDLHDDQFQFHSRGRRTEPQARELWEREANRRWRAFGALIKATLVAVEEGILPLNQALAPYAMLPNRRTVAEETASRMETLPGAPMALPWSTE